jgi:SOS-response transcriptional repressor LexA
MALTDRQQQVLDYLRQHIAATGLPPTISELMAAFGWASPNAAAKHLDALIAKGAIEMAPHKARTIRLVGASFRSSQAIRHFLSRYLLLTHPQAPFGSRMPITYQPPCRHRE